MTSNTNDSPRLGGSLELDPDDVQRLPFVSLLPRDFPQRLERFKEVTGLTWSGLAAAIGVDYKQMYRGARGSSRPGEPCTPFTCTPPGSPADCRSSWARVSS